MLKKTITYEDYNGNERTEDFWFNLNKAELMEMEMSINGGLTEMLNNIIAAEDAPAIISTFKEIILKAYGKKSLDGKRFEKSKQLAEEFSQTEAYSVLFMELATDDKAGAEFVNGLMPKDLAKELDKETTRKFIEKQ